MRIGLVVHCLFNVTATTEIYPYCHTRALHDAVPFVVRRDERRVAAQAAAAEARHSADGTRIEIFVNIGTVEDAALAAASGAEGSGLVRSEFLFLGRDHAPSEDEQHAAYQAIADALAGKPVIVRLLDIGGDKPAPYIAMPAEIGRAHV